MTLQSLPHVLYFSSCICCLVKHFFFFLFCSFICHVVDFSSGYYANLDHLFDMPISMDLTKHHPQGDEKYMNMEDVDLLVRESSSFLHTNSQSHMHGFSTSS